MRALTSIVLAATLATVLLIPTSVFASTVPELDTSQDFQIIGAGRNISIPIN